MAKLIQAKDVDEVIRKHLVTKDSTLSAFKKRVQTGPDIVANQGSTTSFVEVIGFQELPPKRFREFYE